MYTCTSSGPNESVKDPPLAVTVLWPSRLRSTRSPSAGTLIDAVDGLRLAFTAITYTAPLCSRAPAFT